MVKNSKTTAMRKFAKTTTVLFALIATVALSVFAREGLSGKKVVKLTPESNAQYKLTYLNKGNCNVVVKILNNNGSEIFSENIQSNKSFTKPYNLKGLSKGEYTFKVIDADGMTSKTIQLPASTSKESVSAQIKKSDDDKFEVTVLGERLHPVFVNIYDCQGERIFGDYIDLSKSFTKTYDLSKLSTDNVFFEVIHNENVIAKTKF